MKSGEAMFRWLMVDVNTREGVTVCTATEFERDDPALQLIKISYDAKNET